jgi:hypothetical protein
MWEFGDGGCLHPLISFLLSVCWLEKFLLSHGALVVLDLVMYMIVISIVIVEELAVLVFLLFSVFRNCISIELLIYTEECKFVIDNDLDGNYTPR